MAPEVFCVSFKCSSIEKYLSKLIFDHFFSLVAFSVFNLFQKEFSLK